MLYILKSRTHGPRLGHNKVKIDLAVDCCNQNMFSACSLPTQHFLPMHQPTNPRHSRCVGTQYLLLVQHVELISGAQVNSGWVPVVGLRAALRGAVVDGTLVQGAAEGGAVVGGTVEGRALVGGALVDEGGSVEGAGLGAMVVVEEVMVVGGGDSTPCI